uniref:C2H2-type domain-containing protein n=1 Tax=Gadus morhua TaxID=8049 RepID=A0A8C4ZI95_GADMO
MNKEHLLNLPKLSTVDGCCTLKPEAASASGGRDRRGACAVYLHFTLYLCCWFACWNRRLHCPLYGCKRVFTDTVALESHIKDHEIPAESIPGKILLCSSIGCSDSFPDMQQLMQHMRHHHKPNIFFLCESCRAKLRSHRGLLLHLHTCSKVSRAKLKTEQTQGPPAPEGPTGPSTGPAPISVPGPVPSPGPGPVPSPGPGPVPSPSTGPGSVPISAPGPVPSTTGAPASVPSPPPAPVPSPVAASGSPGNSRILWEHTRGRYRCVQCSLVLPNRKAMTAHIHTENAGLISTTPLYADLVWRNDGTWLFF